MMPEVDLDARRGGQWPRRGGIYVLATAPLLDPATVAGPFDPAWAGRIASHLRPENLALATPTVDAYPLPHDVLAEAATVGALLSVAIGPRSWVGARVLVVHPRTRGTSDNPCATTDDVAPGYALALDPHKSTALRTTPCGATYAVSLAPEGSRSWSAAIAEWPISGVLVVGAPRPDIRKAVTAAGLTYREERIDR